MNANKNPLSFVYFLACLLALSFFIHFHFIHINVSDLVKEINRITKFYGVNVKKMKKTMTMTAQQC